jgi:hypothetical protein
MRLNFADTPDPKDDGEFQLLPSGKYHCEITGMTMGETKGGKAPGTPMVSCEYTILDGKYENRKVWDNLVLSTEALWKTKALLMALGLTKEEIEDEDFEFDPEEYVGQELDVRVGKQKETADYDARNKVNGYAVHKTTESELVS